MLSLDRVYKASTVLKEVIRETDMISAPKLNKSCNGTLKQKIYRLRAHSKSEARISK